VRPSIGKTPLKHFTNADLEYIRALIYWVFTLISDSTL